MAKGESSDPLLQSGDEATGVSDTVDRLIVAAEEERELFSCLVRPIQMFLFCLEQVFWAPWVAIQLH